MNEQSQSEQPMTREEQERKEIELKTQIEQVLQDLDYIQEVKVDISLNGQEINVFIYLKEKNKSKEKMVEISDRIKDITKRFKNEEKKFIWSLN